MNFVAFIASCRPHLVRHLLFVLWLKRLTFAYTGHTAHAPVLLQENKNLHFEVGAVYTHFDISH